jgi:hypothetical protein
VSPGVLPSRGHISPRTPGECENPAGAVRRIRVVGKQTIFSNRNTLAPTSFLAESSPRFVYFRCADPVSRLPRQVAYMEGWRCPGQPRFGAVRLLKNSRLPTVERFGRKLFGFKAFSLSFQGRGLDKPAFTGYTALRRATSRCDSSAQIANGSVPGLLMIGREG